MKKKEIEPTQVFSFQSNESKNFLNEKNQEYIRYHTALYQDLLIVSRQPTVSSEWGNP